MSFRNASMSMSGLRSLGIVPRFPRGDQFLIFLRVPAAGFFCLNIFPVYVE